MTTPRRDSLTRFAGLAALAGGGRAMLPAPASATDLPAPITDKWDVTWADRLTGRVLGVFDSPDIGDGGGLFRALLWMNQNTEIYGLKDEEMSAVLVIRHGAIPMVATDEYWARYKVGKKRKVTDWSSNKPAERNPFLTHPAPDGKPSPGGQFTLDVLMKRGGILQPSGVFGVMRAQAAGCAYIMAT